jgi:protein-S-isoprenylcysteine O-methyltransferase Ste14
MSGCNAVLGSPPPAAELSVRGASEVGLDAMDAVFRAVTYATLFIGFVLVFVPSRILSWAGVIAPQSLGVVQGTGVLVTIIGGALALWCVFTFAFVGRGTPAPFDPPRRLVVRGPYRLVRNPMYFGALLALGGAALFYQSSALAGYAGLFMVLAHLFVLLYEEPTLRRAFGDEYEAYCRRVGRWLPRL